MGSWCRQTLYNRNHEIRYNYCYEVLNEDLNSLRLKFYLYYFIAHISLVLKAFSVHVSFRLIKLYSVVTDYPPRPGGS